jgi:hypothetical protein
VLSYPLFVWLLWWLSGKPESVEVLITRRLLLPLLGRLRGAK